MKKKTKTFWNQLIGLIRDNISLVVIIVAAILLELTTGIMYYSAEKIINRISERLVESQMKQNSLCIRNQLAKVEVAVNNLAWMAQRNLERPHVMPKLTRNFVVNNSAVLGSGISFEPDYYPQKGHWYEPYSVRRGGDSIETFQLGSADHDYTKKEFFVVPMTTGNADWSEPYLDSEGAKAFVTTYAAPVRDKNGKIVAVVDADISLDWLNEVIYQNRILASTKRYLVSENGNLLSGDGDATFEMIRKSEEFLKYYEGNVFKGRKFSENSVTEMTDVNGEKIHVYFQPVGGMTDWTFIKVCYDKDIFSRLRHVRKMLLFMALLGLLLITFIVYRINRHLKRLRLVDAEKDRIESELRVASVIQQSMLPHNQLHRDDVDLFGSLMPAREVGGDLFDYFIRDEKLFFCIGDVSGKGAASAMLMGVIHSLFRAFSARENNPAHIMESINNAASRDNDTNMFVTLFIGVLDLPTGYLRYCNAGHDIPLIVSNEVTHINTEANLPVGVMEDMKYEAQETILPPDSTLFLYTDGLTEAKNTARDQFGLKRTEEVLAVAGKKSLMPQQMLEYISEKVQQFVGEAEQSDDLTFLIIRYTPQHFESTLAETLVLDNRVSEVEKLTKFLKSLEDKLKIERSVASNLRLAVEEAVVNVIDYAYPAGTEGKITISVLSDGKNMKVRIVDNGVPFDPTAKEKADTTLSAEDRQIGGLGILLVRELMDSINYERENGQNILTLIKKIK